MFTFTFIIEVNVINQFILSKITREIYSFVRSIEFIKLGKNIPQCNRIMLNIIIASSI